MELVQIYLVFKIKLQFMTEIVCLCCRLPFYCNWQW